MTELELYKFIEKTGSGTSLDHGQATLWVYHWHVDDFAKMIGSYYLDECEIEVRLYEDCITIDMIELCEENDIDINAIFGDN